MSTNQPTPTYLADDDRKIGADVSDTQSVAALDDDKALDELRSKLCQPQPVEKRRWRFW
jgi:hypothetical protein